MVRLYNINNAIRDARDSDAVRNFISLRFFLEDSGLCENDRRSALKKYLRGIPAAKMEEIRRSCPAGLNAVHGHLGKKLKKADATEQKVVGAVLETVKEDMVKNPESFLGRDGWFMALAKDLARVSPTTTKRGGGKGVQSHHDTAKPRELPEYMVQNFGFGEFEVALFLAITAFARVSCPEKTFRPRTRAVIQQSYWQMFKFGHNYTGCECKVNEHLRWLEREQYEGKTIKPNDLPRVQQLLGMVLATTKQMETYAPQLAALDNMYMKGTELERKLAFVPALTKARWGSEDLGIALDHIKNDRMQKSKEAEGSAETETAK